MKDPARLLIQYYEFHDVPRFFTVEYNWDLYIFDSPFNDDKDDYEDSYAIYIIPNMTQAAFDAYEWAKLRTQHRPIGYIKVQDVHFDPTIRRSIDDACFTKMTRPKSTLSG